jgi:hypothetical protein
MAGSGSEPVARRAEDAVRASWAARARVRADMETGRTRDGEMDGDVVGVK